MFWRKRPHPELIQDLTLIHTDFHTFNSRMSDMTAALDRINASNAAQTTALQAETAAIDAAIAAGIGTATPPAGDSQDALNAAADAIDANTAISRANAQKLAAATPASAPVAPAAPAAPAKLVDATGL